jgi:hypothetical protein
VQKASAAPASFLAARLPETTDWLKLFACNPRTASEKALIGAMAHRANVWPDEKKAGLEPAKNHTLRG